MICHSRLQDLEGNIITTVGSKVLLRWNNYNRNRKLPMKLWHNSCKSMRSMLG